MVSSCSINQGLQEEMPYDHCVNGRNQISVSVKPMIYLRVHQPPLVAGAQRGLTRFLKNGTEIEVGLQEHLA